MQALKKQQSGFTAVELLMAMAVFSFILVLSVTGFIQINQMYQQGVAAQRTQSAARVATDDITRTLRESDFVRVNTDTQNHSTVCSSNRQFLIEGGSLYKQSIDDGSPCSVTGELAEDALRLTSDEVEVLAFNASAFNRADSGGSEGAESYYSAQVTIRIATAGSEDLLDDDRCDPGAAGSQFCSVSEQISVVTTRGALQ